VHDTYLFFKTLSINKAIVVFTAG